MKKTRMSGVIDHSTMGLNLGTEMEITKETYVKLRRAMYKASATKNPFNVEFILHNGEAIKGNATYFLKFKNRDNSENTIMYEFKQQGKNYFLNVSGNPSCLVSGSNDIPILIIDSVFEKEYNAATVTFKYMNRIMYSILDTLLADYDFCWDGKDKVNLKKGFINIHSYQIAWYSGDLGSERDSILRHLRVIYGSQDATDKEVVNIAKVLGLKATPWDNSNNLTIEARSTDRRIFTLTWYTKDNHPEYDGDNQKRLQQLIRWDCTLNNGFLINNSIRTVEALEAKYIEICDKSSYDTGFIKYISEKVSDRIKLEYVLSLNNTNYIKAVKAIEEVTNKYEALLAKHWLEYKEPFANFADAAEFFKLSNSNRPRYVDAKNALLNLGIDIDISRSYHEAVLDNQTNATATKQERGFKVMKKHNQAPRYDELIARSEERAARYQTILQNSGGMIRVRKFKPIKVKPSEFWVLKEQ